MIPDLSLLATQFEAMCFLNRKRALFSFEKMKPSRYLLYDCRLANGSTNIIMYCIQYPLSAQYSGTTARVFFTQLVFELTPNVQARA